MLDGLLTLTAHPQLRPPLLGRCGTWEGDKLPEHLAWKKRKSHTPQGGHMAPGPQALLPNGLDLCMPRAPQPRAGEGGSHGHGTGENEKDSGSPQPGSLQGPPSASSLSRFMTLSACVLARGSCNMRQYLKFADTDTTYENVS